MPEPDPAHATKTDRHHIGANLLQVIYFELDALTNAVTDEERTSAK